MRPRVSIITCSYNHASYIAACADSVLRQTSTDWEWLIIDDGSTDGTAEYIQNIKDPRIRFQRAEHRGADYVLERKNELLAQSGGEWIAFLDSDDVWMPSRLEQQLQAAGKSEVVLIHGDIWLIDAAGEKKRRLCPSKNPAVLNNDPIGTATVEALSELNFPVYSNSAMARRSTLTEMGGFRVGPALWDFSMLLEVSLRGRFLYIPEPLSCWRRHADQTSLIVDRLFLQYQANRDHGAEFLAQHPRVLGSGALKKSVENKQERILTKIKEAGLLIRADSFLDIEAWSQARRLYNGYLADLVAGKVRRRPKHLLAALLGVFSTWVRCNLVRTAFEFKRRAGL